MKETPWWYLFLWGIGFSLFKIFFSLKIEGDRKILKKGAAIIVANHRSYLDPVVLALLVPRRMNFMAKEELFQNTIFGWLITKLGAFPLKRNRLDKKAYQRAIEVVKEKKLLALFPEGTRSRSGKLGNFKEGSIRIALHLKVPIVPVVIRGTGKALPAGARFIKLGKIRLKVGRPILPDSFSGEKEKRIKSILRILREEMISMGANR